MNEITIKQRAMDLDFGLSGLIFGMAQFISLSLSKYHACVCLIQTVLEKVKITILILKLD